MAETATQQQEEEHSSVQELDSHVDKILKKNLFNSLKACPDCKGTNILKKEIFLKDGTQFEFECKNVQDKKKDRWNLGCGWRIRLLS